MYHLYIIYSNRIVEIISTVYSWSQIPSISHACTIYSSLFFSQTQVILAVISTITFAMVEWRHHVSNQKCEDSLTNISYDEEPYSGGSRGGPGRARPPLKSCPPFYYLHLTRHTVTSGSLLDRHNARASRSKCLKSASDRRSCLARECARNENNKIDRF